MPVLPHPHPHTTPDRPGQRPIDARWPWVHEWLPYGAAIDGELAQTAAARPYSEKQAQRPANSQKRWLCPPNADALIAPSHTSRTCFRARFTEYETRFPPRGEKRRKEARRGERALCARGEVGTVSYQSKRALISARMASVKAYFVAPCSLANQKT